MEEVNRIDWRLYNRALIARGEVNFWFNEEIVKSWYAKARKRVGAPFVFSDRAILTLSIIRFRFGLSLRATQGFAVSLAKLMDLDITIPCYSTLSRRLAKLDVDLAGRSYHEPLHVVVDSTGLKVFGAGEWTRRWHKVFKERVWRKVHMAINEANNDILSVVMTKSEFHDSEIFSEVMDKVDPNISQVTADGAYDAKNCYKWAEKNNVIAVFPPRRDARVKVNTPRPIRDHHIREIGKIGPKKWKIKTNYHRRSIAETAMYRLKTICGDRLASKRYDNQIAEVYIKCRILNLLPTPRSLNSG